MIHESSFAGDFNILTQVTTAVVAVGTIATTRTPSHLSGYFTLASAVTGNVKMVREIGVCPQDRAWSRFDASVERAHRLFNNPTHISSWQSRDKAREMHAGAIRAGDYILSFAGLPEHADEAAMVYVAYRFSLMERRQVSEVFALSQNEVGVTLFLRGLNIDV